MAHCSEPQPGRQPADFLKDFRETCGDLPKGRRWPEGRLDQSDDGEFQFGLAIQGKTIIIAFDRPVDWIGLTPEQASALGQALIEKSLRARGIAP